MDAVVQDFADYKADLSATSLQAAIDRHYSKDQKPEFLCVGKGADIIAGRLAQMFNIPSVVVCPYMEADAWFVKIGYSAYGSEGV